MTLILEAEQSLAILKVVAEKNTRIKQLEAEKKKEYDDATQIMIDKDSTIKSLEEVNQRLREAIEFEINQPMQIARQQERLQKALEE